MELGSYIQITRYLTTFVFSFFAYQFIISLINFRNHQDKSSVWHSLMCLTTALYCFVFGFNTHHFNQELSNNLLGVFWFFAYSSFYCYLMAIEVFLNQKIKLLIIPKIYCLFLCGAHVLNILTVLLFNKNLLFNDNQDQVTLFAKTMSFTISPSFGTLSLGGLGAIMVIFSGVVVWFFLNKYKNNEPMLKIGIIITILCVLNDSALGLELAGGLIPLYYLGNVFEAFRLNLYYQSLAFKKINSLEAEVDELTKIAQFGTAAASISHDIRNYLMIIHISLRNAMKGLDVNKNVERSLKYTDKSSKVTKIYMNLFKNNGELSLNKFLLYDLVLEAQEIIQDRVEKSGIEVFIDVDKDIEVKCNDVAFTMAIVNLVNNAIDVVAKFENSWIKIQFNRDLEQIEIIDSGNGIPTEIADKIFELNYSTKKHVGGSGLGLAISKQIIEKCGFKLALDRNRKNTTFVISLK